MKKSVLCLLVVLVEDVQQPIDCLSDRGGWVGFGEGFEVGHGIIGSI